LSDGTRMVNCGLNCESL